MTFLEPFTPTMLDGHNDYFIEWLAELGRSREDVVDVSITFYPYEKPARRSPWFTPTYGVANTYLVTLTFKDHSFADRSELWSERKLGMPSWLHSHLVEEKGKDKKDEVSS